MFKFTITKTKLFENTDILPFIQSLFVCLNLDIYLITKQTNNVFHLDILS